MTFYYINENPTSDHCIEIKVFLPNFYVILSLLRVIRNFRLSAFKWRVKIVFNHPSENVIT